MKNTEATVCLVDGRGRNARRVAVGVLIKNRPPLRKAHFKWCKRRHHLDLRPVSGTDKQSTEAELFLDCMIACVISLEHFRRMYPSQFDCEFTMIEGHNLSKDWTMGFDLATFRALAKATGFWPDDYVDNLNGYGWSEFG